VPKGTVFAIGVLNADPEIRPFDEVIVLNEHVIAVGRALMSGWRCKRRNEVPLSLCGTWRRDENSSSVAQALSASGCIRNKPPPHTSQ